MKMLIRSLLFSIALLAVAIDGAIASDTKKPLQVFILAGQSNMEGQAVVDLEGKNYNGGKGTLKALLDDPATAEPLKHLRQASGKWAVREDVWVRYQPEHGPLKAGPLGFGFTPYGDQHHFGPELQFGHVLGDHCKSQVLLIKTAWGGKSLYRDFRPPSAGGEVGPYYTKMISQVREALANLKIEFPSYEDRGYQLAGLVWYQGWNDGVDPQHAIPEYEQNLVHLIHDVRKDLNVPQLPVVIGELTGPWVDAPREWDKLRKAQSAAADRAEFAGTVTFVPTRDFVRKPEESPNPGHGHHEFGNAETYFLVGNALGKGMVSLLEKNDQREKKPDFSKQDEKKPTRRPEPAALPIPTSRTARNIEGWNVLIDDRLLQAPDDALGTRTLRFLEAKLADIKIVVPAERVKDLQKVTIVVDLTHGKLRPMQYHPSADWLKDNGYSADLAKCVHVPHAADLPTSRNVREQPWVILHELSHAYHDQVLGFDDPRIKLAYEHFKQSGHGDQTLLFNGKRVKHYALTNHKEFFAEMTEAYFGSNDFFPFNRAELQEAEPEIFKLLSEIWDAPAASAR